MNPSQAFAKMRTKIEAQDRSMVKAPVYKVEERVVEAQRLHKVGEKHMYVFEKIASVELFDMNNVVDLDTIALALRHAETDWIILRNPTRSDEFVEKLALADEMRAGLLRDLDYVNSRFSPEGLGRTLSTIREGSTRQDSLQDLETLAVLARKHKDALSNIGFEQGMADQASNLAAELGRVLNVDKSEMERSKETRDRASTLLERMMTETRTAAAFLFRNDADTLADFKDQGRR